MTIHSDDSDLSTVCVYVNKLFLVDGVFTIFGCYFFLVCFVGLYDDDDNNVVLIHLNTNAMLNVSFCWITYQSGVI